MFAAAMLLAAAGGAQAQSCTYRTPPSLIQFSPALDPSLASTRTASTSTSIQCTGGASRPTWIFTGANGSSPLRMKHSTQNEFISYDVTASYVSGGVGNQQWNITATVLGADYQNARVGDYSDVLTAQILP